MGKLEPDGDKLVAYRSKNTRTTTHAEDGNIVDGFGSWTEHDGLPLFEDYVSGFNLTRPHDDSPMETLPRNDDWPTNVPDHSSFGPKSCVDIPIPSAVLGSNLHMISSIKAWLTGPVAMRMKWKCVDLKEERIPLNQTEFYQPKRQQDHESLLNSDGFMRQLFRHSLLMSRRFHQSLV
jgi:hypothetical protein